eukprot:990088-Pleurochrysis_carterae.AAC.2
MRTSPLRTKVAANQGLESAASTIELSLRLGACMLWVISIPKFQPDSMLNRLRGRGVQARGGPLYSARGDRGHDDVHLSRPNLDKAAVKSVHTGACAPERGVQHVLRHLRGRLCARSALVRVTAGGGGQGIHALALSARFHRHRRALSTVTGAPSAAASGRLEGPAEGKACAT